MKYLILIVFLCGCATTKSLKDDEEIIFSDTEVIKPLVKNEEKEIVDKKDSPIVKQTVKVVKKEVLKPAFVKEKAVYDISLKGIHSGTAVIKSKGKNKKLDEFSAYIKTSPFISMFFNVEHKIRSLWDKSTGSHYFSFDGIEGEVKKKRTQQVNSRTKKISIVNQKEKDGKKSEKKSIKPWISPTQDFLSSFFFVRTIDWVKDKKIRFLVLDDGKVQKVVGSFKGIEEIKVNGKKYKAKIIEVTLQDGGSSLNKFWISDKNVLVKIQANLKIGVMVFELDRYSKDL